MRRHFLLISFLITFLFLLSCAPASERKYDALLKAWTPEVRDTFIGMGKASGCFSLKELPGRTSCYIADISFDKTKGQWVTKCEPLCRIEEPRCYADGWNPPQSSRCKHVEEWHRVNDKVRP